MCRKELKFEDVDGIQVRSGPKVRCPVAHSTAIALHLRRGSLKVQESLSLHYGPSVEPSSFQEFKGGAGEAKEAVRSTGVTDLECPPTEAKAAAVISYDQIGFWLLNFRPP